MSPFIVVNEGLGLRCIQSQNIFSSGSREARLKIDYETFDFV